MHRFRKSIAESTSTMLAIRHNSWTAHLTGLNPSLNPNNEKLISQRYSLNIFIKSSNTAPYWEVTFGNWKRFLQQMVRYPDFVYEVSCIFHIRGFEMISEIIKYIAQPKFIRLNCALKRIFLLTIVTLSCHAIYLT